MAQAFSARPSVRVTLEPVYNALNSFALLNMVGQVTGLNTWVVRTAAALDADVLLRNRMVFEGLRDALVLPQEEPDMPAYLKALAGQPPELLRDRVLEELRTRYASRVSSVEDSTTAPPLDLLLADQHVYLTCVEATALDRPFDAEVQRAAHTLLHDAPALHTLLLGQLEALWKLFAGEWRRVQGSLKWQVEMFTRALDEEPLIEESYRQFSGRTLPAAIVARLVEGSEVILVPSWHSGHQITLWENSGTTRLFFSTPPNYDVSEMRAKVVGSAELRARVGALNDETRLRIIELLMQRDEMEAQDILDEFELSQSSVSRHLKQLVMAGYLYERRGEGANKTYRLSPFYFALTARAIEQLVAGDDIQRDEHDEREGQSRELRRFLDRSGKLITWPPARQRDKLVILTYLASFFRLDRVYSEKEVNEQLLLHSVVRDSAALRRALCEYGFMNRMRDGSGYWLTASRQLELPAAARDDVTYWSAEELRERLRARPDNTL